MGHLRCNHRQLEMIHSCPRVRKMAKILSSQHLQNILCFLESAGWGEGGPCCSPGTAEMLRLHGRSGDNDQKLFPTSWESFRLEKRFMQRRGLHKSQRRAKKGGGGKLPGIITVIASAEPSAKPFVLMLCAFFHAREQTARCSSVPCWQYNKTRSEVRWSKMRFHCCSFS